MDVQQLFKGIAVIIDDQIEDGKANVSKIIEQVKEKNIPYLSCKKLPPDDFIPHFQNISFVILDWKLVRKDLETGEEEKLIVPDTLKKENNQRNLDFIRKLNELCLCPIFIFTNESIGDIVSLLQDGLSYSPDTHSNIFIQSKSDLEKENALFTKIEEWLKDTPSIYVLKEWEKEYQNSKNKLFTDMQLISAKWPLIMWKNFGDDGVVKSLELGELISRNLYSRMAPFEFDEEILGKEETAIEKAELRKLLEGARYLDKKCLNENDIGTGDLFKEEYQDSGQKKYKYYLNIRPQCDLLRDNGPDKLELYCLRGREMDKTKVKADSFNSGHFLEKINNAIIPFIDNGTIVEFLFKDIKLKKWGELKEKRIGRILPPYINHIQQRYGLYIQRQGLPRTPTIAIDFFVEQVVQEDEDKN